MKIHKTLNNLLKIFSFSILLSIPLRAQQSNHLWQEKQAYNWAFGQGAGLAFETGEPVPVSSSCSTLEGSACISNPEGELLFYGAMSTLYDKNGDIMLNGHNLYGFDTSSTQAGVIVPKPGNSDIYYAFGAVSVGWPPPGTFSYSEVDMTLNGGLGAVTENKNIELSTVQIAEKITAVYHANGVDVWVIVHAMGTNEYMAYLVTEQGVSTTPVISAVGLVYSDLAPWDYGAGQMKASPDGSKIASMINGVMVGLEKGFEVLDFDNETGVLSNPIFVETDKVGYTLEFSPNSKYLYVVECDFAWLLFINSKITQYDVTVGDLEAIQDSATTIADLTGSLFVFQNMQLAPDGRIYVSNMVGANMLNVIKNPNNHGTFAGFQPNTVYLGDGEQSLGMPTFNQTYFESGLLYEGRCTNQPITFSTLRIPDITAITWNFGDPGSGEANISTEPSHLFSAPGTYTVTAEITSNDGTQIATVEVEVLPGPEAIIPAEELRALCSQTDGTATFDLTLLESIILNNQDPEVYDVAFYASEENFHAGVTIATPAAFVTSGQTIFASVSGGANGCVNVISFDLVVNPPPVLIDIADVEACGNINGVASFNLRSLDVQLLDEQDVELFDIVYYSDPEGNVSISQPEIFESQTTVVYAKVTNKATACSSWMPIDLIVLPFGDLIMPAIAGCSPFDLTQVSQALPQSYILTYYRSEEDALAGNLISTPEAYMAEGNSGEVYVVAQDMEGCYLAGPLALEAENCVIPRGISPNNDNKNDTFDLTSFSVSSISIFNRYGMEVYSFNNYTNQWHGQDNGGNELPAGTYYYSLHLAGGENLTGWVYINRQY